MSNMIELSGVSKSFVMHLQGGAVIPVVQNVSLHVGRGECVVLGGASGAGKSSVLKMIFGSYRCERGSILVCDGNNRVDVAAAQPRTILALRARTIGYVSQFLRVIPRASTLDIVARAARSNGDTLQNPEAAARDLLARVNIPERLWSLPPATFSGGEQQRVNIARGFAANRPILLLDEPTASLDPINRAVVVDMLREAKSRGTAILAIFHDDDVRSSMADRVVDVAKFTAPGSP